MSESFQAHLASAESTEEFRVFRVHSFSSSARSLQAGMKHTSNIPNNTKDVAPRRSCQCLLMRRAREAAPVPVAAASGLVVDSFLPVSSFVSRLAYGEESCADIVHALAANVWSLEFRVGLRATQLLGGGCAASKRDEMEM